MNRGVVGAHDEKLDACASGHRLRHQRPLERPTRQRIAPASRRVQLCSFEGHGRLVIMFDNSINGQSTGTEAHTCARGGGGGGGVTKRMA